MKILVIDDSPEIFDALSLCFDVYWDGATDLVGASDGKRGLALAEEQVLDLVILDVTLPDMCGLEVLRSLRVVSDVPVVMLSARGEDVEVARFLKEGADDYVVKPFNPVDLMYRLEAVCGRAHRSFQCFGVGTSCPAIT